MFAVVNFGCSTHTSRGKACRVQPKGTTGPGIIDKDHPPPLVDFETIFRIIQAVRDFVEEMGQVLPRHK